MAGSPELAEVLWHDELVNEQNLQYALGSTAFVVLARRQDILPTRTASKLFHFSVFLTMTPLQPKGL